MDSELSKKIARINELKKTATELREKLVNAKRATEIREILKDKESKLDTLGQTAYNLDKKTDRYFGTWAGAMVRRFYSNEEYAKEIVEEYSHSTTPVTHDQLTETNARNIINLLDKAINRFQTFLAKVSPAVDTTSIASTEKEFLSQKVPKEVAEHIASYVSGKEGSIGAQVSQLRVKHGKSGVPSKGGRKTKKKRVAKKKTRRV